MPRDLIRDDQNKAFLTHQKEDPRDRIDVVLGDDKDPSVFHPQMKMQRWDNEANVSFRLIHDQIPGNVSYTESNGVVEWKKKQGRNEWITRFYEDWGTPEGAYKFVELVLPAKPPTNQISFTTQSKDVDFFYQPALTPEEIAEGAERPIEVEGSYAIYSKSSGGMNFAGGKEYKTGKIGHLYRAYLEDANGNRTWAEYNTNLNETGILTITVDQTWLDNAVYPVVVDPTFGYTSQGASNLAIDSSSSDRMAGHKGASISGELSSVSAYLKSSGGSTNYQLHLYSDSSGTPNASLVGTSNQAISGSSYALRTATLSYTMSGDYWAVAKGFYAGAGTNVDLAYDTGGTANFGAKWDSSWFLDSNKYSIYATYVKKFQYLVDNFNDNSINFSGIWSANDAAVEQNQRLEIPKPTTTSYNGLYSYGWDLIASEIFLEVVDAGNQSHTDHYAYPIDIYTDAGEFLYWEITQNVITAYWDDGGGATSVYTTTYNSTTHKWLRIREASGTTYWDSSTDGSSWTNRGSVANPFTLTNLKVGLEVYSTGSNTTTVIYDNVNVAPAAGSASPSVSPSASSSRSPSVSPSVSPSSSPSPSASPSRSASVSPSASASRSPSVSPSASSSISPSSSPSPSASTSASPSVSPSASDSVSPSVSPSASDSVSPSVSISASPSSSPSPSASDSASPSVSPSVSPSASDSVSPSSSPSTGTASPSVSPSVSPSASPSPSSSPSASSSISPSSSPSPSASPSVSPSVSPSASDSVSPSTSPSPSSSPSVSTSVSPSESPSPSASPSVSPSVSASVSPSASGSSSPSPSASPSQSPSISPSMSISASPSSSPSPSASTSASPSISPSASTSISPSASPSAAYDANSPLYFQFQKPFSMRLNPSRINTWNESGRPTGKTGAIGYNTETGKIELYDGSGWQTFTKD